MTLWWTDLLSNIGLAVGLLLCFGLIGLGARRLVKYSDGDWRL